MRYWRSLGRGEARDLDRLDPQIAMHSDADDVGYGGTLGFEERKGQPGLWDGRGFWNAEDIVQSINVIELRAVRLLLYRHFADYVSDPRTRCLWLHEYNQAILYIMKSMVSASKVMMAELRKLDVLLRFLAVCIEAR